MTAVMAVAAAQVSLLSAGLCRRQDCRSLLPEQQPQHLQIIRGRIFLFLGEHKKSNYDTLKCCMFMPSEPASK